jgi:hypothetical protein
MLMSRHSCSKTRANQAKRQRFFKDRLDNGLNVFHHCATIIVRSFSILKPLRAWLSGSEHGVPSADYMESALLR